MTDDRGKWTDAISVLDDLIANEAGEQRAVLVDVNDPAQREAMSQALGIRLTALRDARSALLHNALRNLEGAR